MTYSRNTLLQDYNRLRGELAALKETIAVGLLVPATSSNEDLIKSQKEVDELNKEIIKLNKKISQLENQVEKLSLPQLF